MIRQLSSSQWQVLWLTLGISCLLWLMGFLGLSQSLMTKVAQIYSPVQKVIIFSAIEIKANLFQIKEAWSAEKSLVALRREQAKLMTGLVELKAVSAENQVLRKMLENSDRKLIKIKITAPITSFAQPAIGLGRDSEISSGMQIISQNHLLGFVTEVKSTQSLVALLEQTQTQPILAETLAGIKGLVRGDGHQIWLLEVPPDQVVAVGDVVVTLGQTGVTPKLILGKVSKIEKNLVSATQKILLSQPISFYELALIEVH